MNVYFTSDLHFGDVWLSNNIRKMSVEDCSNLIINNWNNTVTDDDLVYVLGDIIDCYDNYFDYYASLFLKLNGNKIVLLGNNDTSKTVEFLIKNNIPILGAFKHKNIMISHLPMHVSELQYYNGNIHGHQHMDKFGKFSDLGEKYFNVNTEYHNYTPINLDDIMQFLEK